MRSAPVSTAAASARPSEPTSRRAGPPASRPHPPSSLMVSNWRAPSPSRHSARSSSLPCRTRGASGPSGRAASPVTLTELVERYAQFEKRAVGFYRGLAGRFATNAEAARLWQEMSNTEASHFALLELAQDWIAMAKGAGGMPPVTAADLDALAARLDRLEAAAAAVGLSIEWEELELPRIVELVRHLPPHAQGRVMAGMIAEAGEHYRMLMELVRAVGDTAQTERVSTLERSAREAIG